MIRVQRSSLGIASREERFAVDRDDLAATAECEDGFKRQQVEDAGYRRYRDVGSACEGAHSIRRRQIAESFDDAARRRTADREEPSPSLSRITIGSQSLHEDRGPQESQAEIPRCVDVVRACTG